MRHYPFEKIRTTVKGKQIFKNIVGFQVKPKKTAKLNFMEVLAFYTNIATQKMRYLHFYNMRIVSLCLNQFSGSGITGETASRCHIHIRDGIRISKNFSFKLQENFLLETRLRAESL